MLKLVLTFIGRREVIDGDESPSECVLEAHEGEDW